MTDDTNEILRDIRRWLKIIGIQEAKPVIRDALSDEDEEVQRALRITYHLTNGEHSTRDIAEYIQYEYGWVATRQGEWSNMGLVERDSPNASYQHIIGLEEIGLEVPELPEINDDAESEDE